MIRLIAAIDSKKGIADEHGIPWNLPTDKAYFRNKTTGHKYLIGYGTYVEHDAPLPGRETYVATNKNETLRPGFQKVSDPRVFLQESTEDIWVGGGAGLFESVLDLADEIYLTRIDADFNCTKFFPDWEDAFELVSTTEPQQENNLMFRFEVWKPKLKKQV